MSNVFQSHGTSQIMLENSSAKGIKPNGFLTRTNLLALVNCTGRVECQKFNYLQSIFHSSRTMPENVNLCIVALFGAILTITFKNFCSAFMYTTQHTAHQHHDHSPVSASTMTQCSNAFSIQIMFKSLF